MSERLLTVNEVAERLNVSSSFVRRLIAQGILISVRLATEGRRGTIRVEPNEVRRYLQVSRKGASPADRSYKFMV